MERGFDDGRFPVPHYQAGGYYLLRRRGRHASWHCDGSTKAKKRSRRFLQCLHPQKQLSLEHPERNMASNQQDIDIDEAFVRETADFILSKLDIYPSGACGPRRDAPIDCFKPIHQPYHHESHHDHAALASLMASTVPGSIPRAIGDAVVYDRDIVTTWRLPSCLAAYEVFF